MMRAQTDPDALHKQMNRPDVRIIDASWALDGSDMKAAFAAEHIEGAQFFDIDVISDHSLDLPHMAPDPEAFAEALSDMGVAADDTVVIYDREGLFSAARVWWTFKLMGHDKAYVLRGGLPGWKAAGYSVTDKVTQADPNTYFPEFQPQLVVSCKALRAAIGQPGVIVLDARSEARFNGTAPEPRPGLRSGHMPGSLNLPYTELLRDGCLKPKDELHSIFKALGVTADTQVITTCGSGVTAAILFMALYEIGHPDVRLYDGAWAEWGQLGLETPVITDA
jgi:thiosulfate/3-mercaptopyruvate sulfurtransferase